MGKCVHCDQPAGVFKKVHKECAGIHKQGKQQIVSLVSNFGMTDTELESLAASVKKTAHESFIDKGTLQKLVAYAWHIAVEGAFEDGILTEIEENDLIGIKNQFSLTQTDLDKKGAFTKVVKGALLRDICEGTIPDRLTIDGNLPFNFQKTEKIAWVFQNVDYFEEKTRSHYVGGSAGVSVRVAKGLYFRTGAFKGERVQSSETVHTDTGVMALTNKHIYFAGESKRFRIRFDKIVAFEPYSDGIGIQRDAATAKLQSFVTNDGWFTYNLITNLSQL
ncbi:hypothetical protein MNBD_ALPHA03-1544 [hydrothermal vent metagenome]|uniref:Uncharacterized protein n=1 Tax=hydrothermal vent metagenome TaxID=652676 RepID=A0A3B1BQX2_9ZZZZ